MLRDQIKNKHETQLSFTYTKSTIEAVGKRVKYVQS